MIFDMPHTCHAYNCKLPVPPKLLFCAKHWRMTPVNVQRLIWKTYREGQEIDKQPSREYLFVQRAAVWAVFVEEGGCTWPDVPEVGSDAYMIGPGCIGQRR